MKKLTVLLLMSICFSSFAQEKISSYESSYFKKSYDVLVGKPNKKDGFTFYISVPPADRTKEVALMIESADQPKFVASINEVKSIYEKWVKTAKENNVTELSKEIPVKFASIGAAFTYGDWKFDYHVTASPRFKILDGKYLLILESDELIASSNQFMKCDGFLLVFASVDEIDSFLKAIDIGKATEHMKTKSSKEDLFN